MKDLDNGMKGGLSLFHFNSIIPFFTTTYELCETKLRQSFHIILLVDLKQYIYCCFEQWQLPTVAHCQQQLALFSHIGNFSAVQSFYLHCIAMHVLASVKALKSLRCIWISFWNRNRNC